MHIFITGIGSGFGEALAREYLEAGHEVYALSRFLPRDLQSHPHLHFHSLNLFAHEKIEGALHRLLQGKELDIAILNAGILGELRDMSETSLHEITSVMNLNVWANKVILDFFKNHTIKQIVAISSGASISGSRGWNAYALSKATLNMLIKLYAQEMPNTHLCAVAPGLIDTPMMEHIIKYGDAQRFPVVQRLKTLPKMTPKEAAKNLMAHMKNLLHHPSGSYLDLREL